MIINGTVSRTTEDGRDVDIPFFIDSDTGTYSQWGHDMLTLGENVDLLEAIRDAMLDTD
ncbi:Cobalamin biosynthesis protein CobP [uncultured Mycobacterium sp.]|uniref:Cobalamin biosynthesis protein CobP n=1 Tax=uncultured Mycobacterium sp. TaxID=171292 RepID=A0A1Y5PMU6_9MYCO|nr:Cobalamin biosynthesis protein CobP [uncultured Mycobacterium sp.]